VFSGTKNTRPTSRSEGDFAAALIAEYEALRQEVGNRQTLSYAIIAVDLAAFGSGVTAAGGHPEVMIGLAVVSTLLWMFWQAQTMQIDRIAAYVALRLRPALVRHYGYDVLGWEGYVRRLTWSRETAVHALYDGRRNDKGTYISRSRDGIYISLLLGGGTPLFLGFVSATEFQATSKAIAFEVASALGLVLWAYALVSAISVMRADKAIARQIIESDTDLRRWLDENASPAAPE
jgi:hypothetical protein